MGRDFLVPWDKGTATGQKEKKGKKLIITEKNKKN
jgi:hypothetical protein